ncbi:YIP1 family protein [Massilia cavernae]|uniref:YIP1 family protein n=1 Tax=Massilia cavernae TaxID=2320864 RepID=A0A418Y116_9BURK|nr:YIP1 family protein [Massilia cavernae]RJG19098.1 YIP1 family protein [Massilia cavernae]
MSNNVAAIPLQILVEPSKAFAAIRERSHTWLPLLTVMFGSALMIWWYFQTVDFAWLMNHTMASQPDMTDEQRQAAQGIMSQTTMGWMSVAGALIVTPVIYAIFALYYLLAGKFLGSDISFGKWFALTAWASLPRLLVLPLMAMQIMTSGGQVPMEDLSMTSLNFLLFQLPQSHPWAGFLTNIDLAMLWSVVLSVIGLRVWTARSLATCVTISLLPLVLVFGLWAGKIVMFA